MSSEETLPVFWVMGNLHFFCSRVKSIDWTELQRSNKLKASKGSFRVTVAGLRLLSSSKGRSLESVSLFILYFSRLPFRQASHLLFVSESFNVNGCDIVTKTISLISRLRSGPALAMCKLVFLKKE